LISQDQKTDPILKDENLRTSQQILTLVDEKRISQGIDHLIATYNPHAHEPKNLQQKNDMDCLLDAESIAFNAKQLTKMDLFYMQRHSLDRDPSCDFVNPKSSKPLSSYDTVSDKK